MIPHDHLVRCALLIEAARRSQTEAGSLGGPVLEAYEAERELTRVCRMLRHT